MASDFRLKEQLPRFTDRIVETYKQVGKINHLGHCPLPKYNVIVSALEDLKDVIFPGYRRREGQWRFTRRKVAPMVRLPVEQAPPDDAFRIPDAWGRYLETRPPR